MGIPVTVDRAGTPKHRLVTVEDSLIHVFQSGAIFNTKLSYPAIIAREMGWNSHFRHPTYASLGDGLPLNALLGLSENLCQIYVLNPLVDKRSPT